ncbi:MAG: iron transporter [Lachnospiraceae bacterium]|nr:iron transporter [Lachnospiraceae bacterium]
MKKRLLSIVLILSLFAALLSGCGKAGKAAIEDGVYLASFDTDGTMFHVNETRKGKGILTVKDGEMTIHIVMPSKNVVNLFYGTAEDAKKDGAALIDPVVEEVTYEDGTSEEVNAFDLPVPDLDEEYDVALIGKKQQWYDHKVKVSDPEPFEESPEAGKAAEKSSSAEDSMTAEVTLTGGTGKASVTSPAKVREEKGQIIATVEWSSPYYDYMIVGGQKYERVNTEGNSVFEIPIPGYNEDFTVIADTVAMSKPHEIEYVLNFRK